MAKEGAVALKNRRQEKFARELAKGRTAVAAYTAAGYAGHRASASRLARPSLPTRGGRR